MSIACVRRSELPNFKKDVYFKEDKIATIKALSRRDYGKMKRAGDQRTSFEDGKVFIQINTEESELMKIKLSLVSWEFDFPITIENINDLVDDYYDAILDAINKLELANNISEDILGNLEQQPE
jgi:hypothetical protein